VKRAALLLTAGLTLALALTVVHSAPRPTPEQAARAFLRTQAPRYGLQRDLADLRFLGAIRSLAGWYARFQQTWGGVAVWGGEVVVFLTPGLGGRSVFSAYVSPGGPPPAAPVALTPVMALQQARTALDNPPLIRPPVVEPVAWPGNQRLRLAYRTELATDGPRRLWEVFVDAQSGAILAQRDRLVYRRGRVFVPNPIVTSGNTGLRDRRDRNSPNLSREIFRVKLRRLDGSGMPRGRFCWATGKRQAVNKFTKSRRHYAFEQVNAYYHIDAMQKYLHRLGFFNANNRQQMVECNTIPEDCSFYSPATTRITFGAGGVDDAEDAEIVMHEYGHAIQYNQVPTWGRKRESRAMGEGFGDFLGGSYGAFLHPDPVFDPCVGEWDSTAYSRSDPPCLRRLDSAKHYPEDLVTEPHLDGEIWSAALWNLQKIVGRDDAHRLIIESHFALPGGATFSQGATAILNTNASLRGGADQAAIRAIFQADGIL